jgi:hypothetical protein
MTDLRKEYAAFREKCLSTNFQKDRHIVKPGTPEEPQEDIQSIYLSTFIKATWVLQLPIRFPSTDRIIDKDGNLEIRFRMPGTALYHGLTESHYSFKLPSLSFKEEYEGRWCMNPLLNSFISAKLSFNDTQIQNLDSIYLDHYLQNFSKDREASDAEVGNQPFLQNWSQNIPSYTTSFTLPWFYSLSSTSFFPIYLCNSLDRLDHVFVVRQKIDQMVYTRRHSSGVGVEQKLIPFNNDFLTKPVCLPTPEYWGDIIYMTDTEADTFRCNNMHKNIMFYDIIRFDDKKNKPQGNLVVIQIKEKFPVHCLFWGATDGKFLSNYTITDTPTIGSSPIQNSSLLVDKLVLFDKLENWQTERHYPSRKMTRAPWYPGHNSFCFSNLFNNPDTKSGLLLRDAEFSVQLEPEQCDISEYRVHLYGVVSKELIFMTYPTTEMERQESTKFSTLIIRGDV